MVKRRKRKLRKGVIFLFLLLIVGGVGTYLVLTGKIKFKEIVNKTNEIVETPIKKIQIVDEESTSRPIAVMINNHPSARPFQSGLQDSYIMYEFIVEGGLTRYLALFLDKETERIGSIRSARHYFLDYALENDAIYIHHGTSPQASADFHLVDRIEVNEYRDESISTAWRDDIDAAYEHTLFTSIKHIERGIKDKRIERNNDLLLDYSVYDIDLTKKDGNIKVEKVEIPYSNNTTTSYKYDDVEKVYYRYVNDKEHVDYVTKKQYSFKNIITYKVKNYTLVDVENKGRQGLENIGKGEGYYISNGYAVGINWEKKCRECQTKYTYKDGSELVVNDGNTFIQVQPVSKELILE